MLRVGGEPEKTAGPTLRGTARSRTLQEGPKVCCRAAFNLEKVVLGVLAKMELIRAEQLAGLLPSTWFQRKESLSTSVLSCLEKSKFSGSRSCYARFVARGEVPVK